MSLIRTGFSCLYIKSVYKQQNMLLSVSSFCISMIWGTSSGYVDLHPLILPLACSWNLPNNPTYSPTSNVKDAYRSGRRSWTSRPTAGDRGCVWEMAVCEMEHPRACRSPPYSSLSTVRDSSSRSSLEMQPRHQQRRSRTRGTLSNGLSTASCS